MRVSLQPGGRPALLNQDDYQRKIAECHSTVEYELYGEKEGKPALQISRQSAVRWQEFYGMGPVINKIEETGCG